MHRHRWATYELEHMSMPGSSPVNLITRFELVVKENLTRAKAGKRVRRLPTHEVLG